MHIACDSDPSGPYGLGLTAAGRLIRLQVSTTAGALRTGQPVRATPCPGPPLDLGAGRVEVAVNPGRAFTVDTVLLDAAPSPTAGDTASDTVEPAVTEWTATRRTLTVPAADRDRVLSVPESTNPGWHARIDGVELAPVVVDGWQQGWVVPAGEQGTITLSFPSNATYRTGLAVGLSLLPLLALLAFVPARRPPPAAVPAQPWSVPVLAGAGVLAVGGLIAGLGGLAVFGAALLVTYALRHRSVLRDRVTLGTASCGLILAGAVLSRYPWRSVDGYVGHSPWVQLPALIALGALAASALPAPHISDENGEGSTASR